MRTVCLVPRRADGGRRDEIWAWVKARWEREHPDIEIFEGHDDGPGKFNRSKAINLAAEAAGEWDVAVISDSDTFVDAAQILRAIVGAVVGPCRFWLAYDSFNYLSRRMSELVMAGFDGYWGADNGIEWSMTGTCSSMLVVTRTLWDEVCGFDESFEGWGFEDVAFSHACQTFGDGVNRVPGGAWHLHHTPSADNDHRSPEWIANQARMMEYHAVSYDPAGMRALIDSRRVARVG